MGSANESGGNEEVKALRNLTADQILKSYELPHRLLVYFASQVAKDALSRVKSPDERSLHAIDVAERFGNGESFTEEELKEVCAAAHAAHAAYVAAHAPYVAADAAYAVNAAAYAAYAAAKAAYVAVDAAYAVNAAAYAANAAAKAAVSAGVKDNYKSLLLELIETRLSKLERLLILGEI